MANEIKQPSNSRNAEPVVKEVTLDASIQKVWAAISDKDEMKNWYFELDEFKPEVGFEFQFEGENEGRKFLHLCKVTEAIVEQKLAYSWKYKGYTGESFVTFELFAEGDKTRLKLTHEGIETFPAEATDFVRENFEAGWNDIILISLKDYLEQL